MNLSTFQPRSTFVLVKKVPIKKEETGGIIIPGGEYGNFIFATVVNVGPGNAAVSNDGEHGYDFAVKDLHVGDLVLIKTGHSGNALTRTNPVDITCPFTVAGEKVLLIHEGAIIAIVTKETTPVLETV